MRIIDINADLGEGSGTDEVIMPLISSCNIACGGHAGDEQSMRTTLELARRNKVKAGAHPSYPDRAHFGRRSLAMSSVDLIASIRNDEMLAELIGDGFANKLRYYPTTTREQSPKMGRITDLMRSGEVYADLNVDPINPDTDRAMVCGNLAFNLDIKDLLEGYGLEEGANSKPAQYVVEKAFLD